MRPWRSSLRRRPRTRSALPMPGRPLPSGQCRPATRVTRKAATLMPSTCSSKPTASRKRCRSGSAHARRAKPGPAHRPCPPTARPSMSRANSAAAAAKAMPPPARASTGSRWIRATPAHARSRGSTAEMRLAAMLLCACLCGSVAAQETFDVRLRPSIGALERGDFAQAIDSLKPLAAQNIADAQHLLALALEGAPEAQRDLKAAHGWYLRAAEAGVLAAQNNLGAMYFDGRGVAQDFEQALAWYLRAARSGHLDAQYNLALMYGRGQGVERNDREMAKWLVPAAKAGSARAQAQLARIYLDGDGVEQNPTEAARWFRRAAEGGHVHAQYYLAQLLQKGYGVERDLARAHDWYLKAADAGITEAMRALAAIYESGLGVPADEFKARLWRERAERPR
ncbi:MAG: hypothetical protein EXR31_00710 [Betaproteobacteria bacterium]|nr:hypothetical protein [Betaproteobacteria bacterium]